jgi:hypothetical protein
MDRDCLDVRAQYYIMDIWDPACLFSTVFGLITVRSTLPPEVVHFVDMPTQLNYLASFSSSMSIMTPDIKQRRIKTTKTIKRMLDIGRSPVRISKLKDRIPKIENKAISKNNLCLLLFLRQFSILFSSLYALNKRLANLRRDLIPVIATIRMNNRINGPQTGRKRF